ncbi:MAG TPA: flagellar hook capping FlgD N-terminal domain-containing protein [Bryobacteraceae bacterium]|nr:flagellar hook capping FlgD N-terminal domain-containing protein [Bryobacteraceae bacterium]
MNVQPMSTQAPAQTGTSTSSNTSSPDDVSENEFLQLLVAQIQYQDPTNPTDSTAFVTQLAQFSSLEQLISIHTDLDTLAGTSSTQNTTSTQGGA